MADMYSQVGQKFVSAIGSGAEAEKTDVRRQWLQKIYEIKRRDRDMWWRTLMEGMRAYSNISDIMGKRKEATEYAESKGLLTEKRNWLQNLFSDPTFKGKTKTYTMADVLMRKASELSFGEESYFDTSKDKYIDINYNPYEENKLGSIG